MGQGLDITKQNIFKLMSYSYFYQHQNLVKDNETKPLVEGPLVVACPKQLRVSLNIWFRRC